MRFSIFTKLALTSLVIIAGLVGFFAYRTSLELERNFAELVHDREQTVEVGIGREVESLLSNLEHQLRTISDEELHQRIVEFLNLGDITRDTLIDRTNFYRNVANIDRLWVISPDGILLASGHPPHPFGDDLFANEESYTEKLNRALEGETVKSIAKESIFTEDIFVAEVFLPVTDYDNFLGVEQVDGIIWGATVIDKAFIEGAAQLADAEIIAVAPNAEPLTSFDEESEPLSPEILSVLESGGNEIDYHGTVYALTTIPFPGTDISDETSSIKIHLLVPKSDLIQRRSSLLRRILIDSIFGGVVAILLVFIIAKSITLPVEQLKDGVARLASGDLSIRVRATSRDEVEDLVNAFNSMADDLDANTRRLVEAEKLSAWREVARRLAHEIKNPLSPIKLSIQNLLKVYRANPSKFENTLDETGETILEEVDRLKTLADEFSNFARMPKLVLGPCDIAEVIKGAVALHQKSESGIDVKLDLDEDLPRIELDRDAMSRVYTNLLKNARESMDSGGGTIAISGSVVRHGGRNWVQIRLRDEGVGMDEDSIKQVFNPYFTTKRGGSGLGLAIVQSIIADHGGRIRIASEIGKGTIVTVELPVLDLI
ncbi:MAG TPA: ATP-binding protein [bacterium]|jgi:signal transduction histidine kinase